MKRKILCFLVVAACLFPGAAFGKRSACGAAYEACLNSGGSDNACLEGWKSCICAMYNFGCA